MKIQQLNYFIAVCETLNFTKAAQRFFISQTAVTQQIKALEDELGVQLFDRTHRHVTITPAGKTFRTDAQEILRRLTLAKNRAQAASTTVTGQLRIGYLNGFERANIAEILRAFHQQYPNVAFTLTRGNVAELYDAVLAERLDVVFNLQYTPQTIPHLTCDLYQTYPLTAVFPATHPLAHRQRIAPEELAHYPLVDVEKHTSRYQEASTITKFFTDAGFLPPVSYLSDDIENTILAVSAGLGYALLPGFFTDTLTLQDRVTSVAITGQERTMRIVLATKAGNSNALLPRFKASCLATNTDH